MTPLPSSVSSLQSAVSRRNWPVFIFAFMFASCLLFAYIWFNTDLGRPQPGDQRSDDRSQMPALTAGFSPPLNKASNQMKPESDIRPQSSGFSNPASDSRPPSSGVRPRWPAVLLVLPFVASILGAYAWFNTDLGRPQPRDQKSEARSQYQNRPPSSDLRLLTRPATPSSKNPSAMK